MGVYFPFKDRCGGRIQKGEKFGLRAAHEREIGTGGNLTSYESIVDAMPDRKRLGLNERDSQQIVAYALCAGGQRSD